MRRSNSLQALRFFAAMAVVYDHTMRNFAGVDHTLGAFGVDVFFVISGYVIAGVAGRGASPGAFLRDRLTRIYPVYWTLSIPWLFWGLGPMPERLWTSITLWPAFSKVYEPYLTPGWTLSFELLFYASVWLVLKGVGPRVLIAGWLLMVGLAALTGWAPLRFIGSPMVLEFLAGVAIARWRLRGSWLLIPAAAAIVLLTGADLGLSARAFDPIGGFIRVALWGVPAAAIVIGALGLRDEGPVWKPIAFMGDASYALYLSHLLVISALLRFVGHGVPVALACALSIPLAILVHLAVEKPLIRDSRALLNRLALRSPAVAA